MIGVELLYLRILHWLTKSTNQLTQYASTVRTGGAAVLLHDQQPPAAASCKLLSLAMQYDHHVADHRCYVKRRWTPIPVPVQYAGRWIENVLCCWIMHALRFFSGSLLVIVRKMVLFFFFCLTFKDGRKGTVGSVWQWLLLQAEYFATYCCCDKILCTVVIIGCISVHSWILGVCNYKVCGYVEYYIYLAIQYTVHCWRWLCLQCCRLVLCQIAKRSVSQFFYAHRPLVLLYGVVLNFFITISCWYLKLFTKLLF